MSSFTNRKHNNNEVYLENIVKKLENENIQNSEKIKLNGSLYKNK